MELRTMEYFSQLCKDLNFTVAAGNLYVTQQALSKAISNLERELGVQLFVRGTSGVVLTELGEAFRQEVDPVLEAVERANKKIQYLKDLNHVCIHMGHVFGIYTSVHWLIEDFCAQHPNIEIVAEEGSDEKCEMDFRSGKLDIICITEPIDAFEAVPVYECPVVLVVAKGGKLDCDLTPEMIADGVLVDYGTEFNMAKRIRAAFARRGLNLTMKPATSDKTAHYRGIRKGTGAFLMSEQEAVEFVAKHPGTTYRPFPFEEEEAVWRLCIKYNEKAFAAEEIREFAEFFEDNCSKYIADGFHEIYSF